MSRRTGESGASQSQFGESEFNVETQLGAAKPTSPVEARERLPTYKGYCNILNTKVVAFRKESIRVQKTIDTVNNAFDTSTLGAALGSLETIITPYQDAVIFMKDQWGISDEMAPEIRATGDKLVKLAGDAIAKAISKYNNEKKADILANGLKSSGLSSKTVSRISSSSSARRMKAIAEVAATSGV
jgi:hypothetical protein